MGWIIERDVNSKVINRVSIRNKLRVDGEFVAFDQDVQKVRIQVHFQALVVGISKLNIIDRSTQEGNKNVFFRRPDGRTGHIPSGLTKYVSERFLMS
jgi:hypothetical protein